MIAHIPNKCKYFFQFSQPIFRANLQSFSRSIPAQADRGLIKQKRKDLPYNIEVFPYMNHFIPIPAPRQAVYSVQYGSVGSCA